MHSNYSVIVIEDNKDIAIQVGDYLTGKGFVVDFAADGKSAKGLLDNQTFDLVILDLMLPDTDGLSICSYIKQVLKQNTPVLMLTARDSLAEKLDGFTAGADDYLTKPFALEEVYVRCLALAKRKQLHQSNTFEIADLSIDFQQHRVSRNEQEIALSATDFKLLKLLAEAYPNALSKRKLAERIWGKDLPETDAVRSHIYTLRNAIDKPFKHALIKTIHGIGFKLEAPQNE